MFRFWNGFRSLDSEEEQAKTMFTGLLAARTTALNGERGTFYPHLIECASLALPPERLRTLTGILPMLAIPKLFSGFSGTCIGRQRQYLVCRDL
jgi:hypothetical protein